MRSPFRSAPRRQRDRLPRLDVNHRRIGFEPLERRDLLAVVTWDGGGDGTSWSSPANWANDIPPATGDDVIIPDVVGSPTIVFSTGNLALNSLVANEALRLTGGSLSVATQANVAANITLQGGTLLNTVVQTSGGAKLLGTANGGTLNGVTLNGDLDVAAFEGVVTLINGLTLNGTATLSGNRSRLDFSGSQTLSGSGTVVLGDLPTVPVLRMATSNSTLTIGAGVTVRGGASGGATIGLHPTGNETNVSVVNLGTIAADASGRGIAIRGQTFTNQGSLKAENGGFLDLFSATTVQSGTTTVNGSGSTLTLTNDWTNPGTISNTGGKVRLGGS